jgi:hypothetical protein
MNGASELAGAILGLIFTLLVFSYIFGDNILFRLTIYIFIGVAAGFAAVVAWYNVIWPQLALPLIAGDPSERLLATFPLVFGALLFFKVSPRLSRLGNLSIAYLVGVGVATTIGGAVIGTIFPQATASMNLLDFSPETDLFGPLVSGFLILLGTLTTLVYFHFGVQTPPGQPARRPEWIETVAFIGQIFIAITFGMLFAGVYSATLTALIERIHFLGDFLLPLFF